jgi:hypothetical protein
VRPAGRTKKQSNTSTRSDPHELSLTVANSSSIINATPSEKKATTPKRKKNYPSLKRVEMQWPKIGEVSSVQRPSERFALIELQGGERRLYDLEDSKLIYHGKSLRNVYEMGPSLVLLAMSDNNWEIFDITQHRIIEKFHIKSRGSTSTKPLIFPLAGQHYLLIFKKSWDIPATRLFLYDRSQKKMTQPSLPSTMVDFKEIQQIDSTSLIVHLWSRRLFIWTPLSRKIVAEYPDVDGFVMDKSNRLVTLSNFGEKQSEIVLRKLPSQKILRKRQYKKLPQLLQLRVIKMELGENEKYLNLSYIESDETVVLSYPSLEFKSHLQESGISFVGADGLIAISEGCVCEGENNTQHRIVNIEKPGWSKVIKTGQLNGDEEYSGSFSFSDGFGVSIKNAGITFFKFGQDILRLTYDHVCYNPERSKGVSLPGKKKFAKMYDLMVQGPQQSFVACADEKSGTLSLFQLTSNGPKRLLEKSINSTMALFIVAKKGLIVNIDLDGKISSWKTPDIYFSNLTSNCNPQEDRCEEYPWSLYVAPPDKHPTDKSKTWTGKGRVPQWMLDYEKKKGKKRDDLLIRK